MTSASQLKKKNICADCVGEKYLAGLIEKSRNVKDCDYCPKKGVPTRTMGWLAKKIEKAFEDHYEIDHTHESETKKAYRQSLHPVKSNNIVEAIGKAAIIEDSLLRLNGSLLMVNGSFLSFKSSPAPDIQEILEKGYASRTQNSGKENPFGVDVNCIRKKLNAGDYPRKWEIFEESLKRKVRFFNPVVEEVLGEIFDEKLVSNAIISWDDFSDNYIFYRARCFYSEKEMKEALKYPEKHLGPPSSDVACAGRMNAHGISVFYGATHKKIALHESRPLVGSYVIVGEFQPQKDLRLLQVNELSRSLDSESIFNPEYIEYVEFTNFMEILKGLISKPVMPNTEATEYLVTQVIAEYLSKMGVDGILYDSVQYPGVGSNVALFHNFSRAQYKDFIVGDRYVHLTSHQVSSKKESYSVSVIVPPRGIAKNNFPTSKNEIEEDDREPLLSLNLKTLEVFYIDSIEVKSTGFSVYRHSF